MNEEFEYEGKIEQLPLPALLSRVLEQKLTGMLHIESSGSKLWIYFEGGFPAGVHAPQSQVFLGSVLREMGLIDDGAYHESMMNMAKTGRLQGELLIEQGHLTEEQLEQALSLQLARKLARLFTIRSGTYSFVEDEELPAPMEPIRVNPYSLITNGIKNSYSEDDLKRSLGMLVKKSCRLSRELADRLPLFEFTEEELADIDTLKEYRSPREFVRTAASGTTAAMMILLALVSSGLLELAEPGLAVPIDTRSPAKPQPAENPPPKKPVSLKKKASPPPKEPARPEKTPPAREPARTARTAGNKLPADLRRRIDEKFGQLETADLWTLLEVGRGADAGQVKKSFLMLTKIFHPDRVAGIDDPGVAERMARISARLNEAFTTLTDPQSRLEYEQEQAGVGGKSSPANAEDALLQFKKAQVFLKKKDMQQATEAIRWAVELEPDNPEYLAHKIWIEFLQDNRGTEEERARRALTRLVPVYKNDKNCFSTVKFLFMLFKRAGDDENYSRFLAQAHRKNPKDIDVAREMRLYNLRQKKDKRGLLGFMRKK